MLKIHKQTLDKHTRGHWEIFAFHTSIQYFCIFSASVSAFVIRLNHNHPEVEVHHPVSNQQFSSVPTPLLGSPWSGGFPLLLINEL